MFNFKLLCCFYNKIFIRNLCIYSFVYVFTYELINNIFGYKLLINSDNSSFNETDSEDDSEDDYCYDPDYPAEEESTKKLKEKYADKPQEFIDYQEKRVDNLYKDFKDDINTFIEERKQDRAELGQGEDQNELKEFNQVTENDVKQRTDEFISDLNALNRCRDDVLINTEHEELVDQASANDEVIKDNVKKHQIDAINNYLGNNIDNASDHGSNIDYVLEKKECEPSSFMDIDDD